MGVIYMIYNASIISLNRNRNVFLHIAINTSLLSTGIEVLQLDPIC